DVELHLDPAVAVIPCRMLLTSTTNGGIRSAAELVDLAVGHQGQTVAVGAPPAVVDGFLAHVLGFEARPRPGLAVRAGSHTVVDVGADGRGVIRSFNGDTPAASPGRPDSTAL